MRYYKAGSSRQHIGTAKGWNKNRSISSYNHRFWDELSVIKEEHVALKDLFTNENLIQKCENLTHSSIFIPVTHSNKLSLTHSSNLTHSSKFSPFSPVIKNATLNGHISETTTNLESKQKFRFILFKTKLFSAGFTHVGTWQRSPPPLLLPFSLLVPCKTERVNGDPKKNLNLLFFLYFFRK